MILTSPVFRDSGPIPSQYTCDSTDVSPPLAWESIPNDCESLALICDDPDAPVGTWVHWVVYNIPPSVTTFPEALPPNRKLPDGTLQGVNDFRRTGYGGPCPPRGTHRYVFHLYALDIRLQVGPGLTRAQLSRSMEGHILASTNLTGTYTRQ